MPIPTLLREAYRIARTGRAFDRYGNAYKGFVPAREAVQVAREAVARKRLPFVPSFGRLGHGDVIRTREADGSRATFVVVHIRDNDMGRPWEEHDGHGIIREVGFSRSRDTADKRPGEVLFSGPHRNATMFAYDVAGTIRQARRDGWGLGPDAMAALTLKAGRTPTRKMIVAEAVRRDLERMAGWAADSWQWIGVALVRLPREECDPETIADLWAEDSDRHGMRGTYAAGLWGIESDSGADYLESVALGLLAEATKGV